jgi:hypothetical protein
VSVAETVLLFAGAPVGAILVISALVLGPGAARPPRYRPGRPWAVAPVWSRPGTATRGAQPGAAPGEAGAPAASAAAGGATGEW